jgi:hypothetical protein
MSANDLVDFYIHTLTVEMYLGTSGYGEDLFAAPVTIVGFADAARHLVRSATGEQVVSESTFVTYPINAPVFAPDSRVTFNGTVSRVIKTNLGDSGALSLPDHVAVSLT